MTRRVELANGLRLIVREMRSSPVVAMNLWVGSGSSEDPDELSGISHFLEHMLFKGASDAAGSDIAQVVQEAGGYLNAETGCDHTMYYQVVPSLGWKDVLRAAVEATAEPAFRPEDVEAERRVVVEESRSAESDPATFVWRRLVEAAFPGHPCGRPVVGTPESVDRVTAEALREHHARHYGSGNLVQVIVGDVDAGEAIEYASGLLDRMPAGGGRATREPADFPADGLKALTYPGGVEQPYVALAFSGPHALHPDVPALDALCGLLGVGHSSRLARRLVSGEGIASDVGAGLVAYRDTGLVVVRAVASTTDADLVSEGIFRETERLRREHPGAAEMEKNIRRLEAGYVLEHETPDSIASTLGFFETLGDYTWSEQYVDRLASVTTDDIGRVAEKYLSPEAATVVCYVPGRSGGPAMDRSRETLEIATGAGRAVDRAVAAVREHPGEWSPPRVLTRPDVLRESDVENCTRLELPGGGFIVVCESHALPIVSVTVGVTGGFTEEPDRKVGLTYLAERMALQGTRTRSADDISEDIEGLGSALASAAERDGFGLGFTAMSRHVEAAAGVLGDVLVNASFPEERLPFVRRRVASEIRESEDHPLRRAILALLPLTFPGVPHGRPLRGTVESIERMTAEELASWHRGRCVAERLRVCVVGDVRPERARDTVAAAVEGLPLSGASRGLEAAGESGEPARLSGSVTLDLPGSAQSVVTIGLRGPLGGTRDAVVARVIVRALSMMGGRFWKSLREQPPYAYHVGGTLLAYAAAGATMAYATAAPGEERPVLNGLLSEFRKLGEDGLDTRELERTRSHLAGTLEISLMRGAARSASYAMAEVMGAGYEYVKGMPEAVRLVTNDDIVRVARTLMDPSCGFAEVILRGTPRG